MTVPHVSDAAAAEACREADEQARLDQHAISDNEERPRFPCPACGELIFKASLKCRYCREALDDSLHGPVANTTENAARWRCVRRGIAKIYYAFAGIVVMTMLLGIANVIIGGNLRLDFSDASRAEVLARIFIPSQIVFLMVRTVALYGLVQCTRAPDAKARRIAIWASVCGAFSLILKTAAIAIVTTHEPADGTFLRAVSFALIVWLVHRCATLLNDGDLAGSVPRFILWIVAGIAITLLIALPFIMYRIDAMMTLAVVIGIVVVVGAVVWYARLLRDLTASIDLYAPV